MLMLPEGMLKRKVYVDGRQVPSLGPFHPVFMPQSTKDFQLLGIGVPEHLWLCQEAAGNLADSIGALTLTANGAVTYQNAITNWTKRGLGFAEVAAQRFQAAAATGPDPATESVAWLVYFLLSAAPGGSFRSLVWAAAGLATTGVGMGLTTGQFMRVNCVAVNVNGTALYADGQVHPALLVYNRTAGTIRVYTDREQVDGVYNAGVVDAVKGFGGLTGAATPLPGNILWGCAVGGAVAETYDKTTLQKLGWTLPY